MPDIYTAVFTIGDLPADSPIFSELLDSEEISRVGRLKIPLKSRRLANVHAQCRLLLTAFIKSREGGFSFDREFAESAVDLSAGAQAAKDRGLIETARGLQLCRGTWGKPHIADHPEIKFNLSHSGNLAAVSMACSGDGSSKIGLDLEEIDYKRSFGEIAARFYHPLENELLNRCGEAEKARLFTEIWTRKEACAKMWGTGLNISFASFSALADSIAAPPNRLLPDGGLYTCRYLHCWSPRAGFTASSAANFVPENALFFNLC
ncbi:4'-phosphopantetheinyl transferase superfamily protein [bacterium]|nr:4'-phosphopantetheinyl transferase superfamily protein [bacterium]